MDRTYWYKAFINSCSEIENSIKYSAVKNDLYFVLKPYRVKYNTKTKIYYGNFYAGRITVSDISFGFNVVQFNITLSFDNTCLLSQEADIAIFMDGKLICYTTAYLYINPCCAEGAVNKAEVNLGYNDFCTNYLIGVEFLGEFSADSVKALLSDSVGTIELAV